MRVPATHTDGHFPGLTVFGTRFHGDADLGENQR